MYFFFYWEGPPIRHVEGELSHKVKQMHSLLDEQLSVARRENKILVTFVIGFSTLLVFRVAFIVTFFMNTNYLLEQI